MHSKDVTFLAALVLGASWLGCGGPTQSVLLLSQKGSRQSGLAQLWDKGQNTEIEIDTRGGLDKNPQLAHIRTGPCALDGRVSGYVLENLETVVNDRSLTFIQNRSIGDLVGGQYHISIQNSADPSLAETCGEIP